MEKIPPNHRSVLMNGVKIDKKLEKLIAYLWTEGVKTSQCCQDNSGGYIWIQFPHKDHAFTYFNMFCRYIDSEIIWTKDYVFDIDYDYKPYEYEFDDGCVSIRIPKEELENINEMIDNFRSN